MKHLLAAGVPSIWLIVPGSGVWYIFQVVRLLYFAVEIAVVQELFMGCGLLVALFSA